MTDPRPHWTGSRNALRILGWCWDLGLRPPAGTYRLLSPRGQKRAADDMSAGKTPLVVHHIDYVWEVESLATVSDLARYHATGKLQATQPRHTRAPCQIGHFMQNFEGVPLIPSNAFLLRRECRWCGARLTWAPMPVTEHEDVDPHPTHAGPPCAEWARHHECIEDDAPPHDI